MLQHNEKSMVDVFVSMERVLPVHEFEMHGVKVWPYVRLSIKNKLDSYFLVNKGKVPVHRPEPSMGQKLRQLAQITGSALKLSWRALRHFSANRFAFVRQFFQSRPVDFLMFCFNSEYMQVGEKQINRNLMGILQGLKQSGHENYQIWEYTSVPDVKIKLDFPGFNITPLSAMLNEWCRWRIALSCFFSQKEAPFVQQVNDYLALHDIPVKLETYKLDHEVRRIVWLANIIERFLRLHSVKKVINICYYGYLGMAVNLACYRAGVLSIEYQHGVQTQFHPMYSNWRNVPEEGYELLPEAFWVWGNATENMITDWAQSHSFHKVLTVGNAWLEFFKQQIQSQQHKEDALLPVYQNKTLILVSLQAFPEHYQSHVTEVMRRSPDDWVWILKEHPRYLLTPEQLQAEFGDMVAKGKVVLERRFSIYELLSLLPIKAHLTAYSTVAFECEYYGVPTVFFHENGINGNSELIPQANHLFAALDADTLYKCVEKALQLTSIKPIYMAEHITVVDELLKDVA
ncbi:hypothetical protein KIH87_04050 [Paraneptunicella aestuarii]|uniref:hypothetical protein n=1 Tax=Paraneptunicella aestuarii TaxID=2831148 RepID=UPI001E52A707|nr:hypothetical protein [Paraneptunicella aestuarii]UAA39539.1 hypothetical protein KIH87_04050 [Paraneptunicella aestuarii]